MRRLFIVTVLVLMTALIILPTALGRLFGQKVDQPVQRDASDQLMINVYFPVSERLEQMPLTNYLIGVVAAEMPSVFENEALKAQFVAARTYAVRRMQQFVGPGKDGCPLNPAADVCADPRTGQAFTTREELETRIGRLAAMAYWRRLAEAQSETAGMILTYQGELIDPLYHAVSGRSTEDSGEYFGQSMPYLKSVDDRWGADAPRLVETKRFSIEELFQIALGTNKDATVPAVSGAKNLVQILSHTTTGRVKSIQVGGVTLTGREFRDRLKLRSTDFTVSVQDGAVLVQTHGHGHGVGMSQHGANGMAKAGYSFKEILNHYYQGATLARIFGE
jgi:stage II sporulation protein D